jgi:hypothetical protein
LLEIEVTKTAANMYTRLIDDFAFAMAKKELARRLNDPGGI